jgi:toxin-antitoxin system PIN domain toxin
VQLVDANVLLHAVNEDSAQHRAAVTWMDGALSGPEPVGFAWVALLAFVRVATRAGAFPAPLSPADALGVVEDWTGAPAAVVVHPTGRHLAILRGLLEGAGTAGNLTTDAHLAALAVEHSARMVSFDRDFERFPGVRLHLLT